MVTNQKDRANLFFYLFVLPAFVLYFLFFIYPFLQGVVFSFTDWNGITPEIQFQFEKKDFEDNVLNKLKNDEDVTIMKNFYKENGNYYVMNEWIEEKESVRRINIFEKKRIKSILSKVGITSINFIGFDNYKEIFTNDKRFLPSFEKKRLYNKKNSFTLVSKVKDRDFRMVLKRVKNTEKDFILSKYSKETFYRLKNLNDFKKIVSFQSNNILENYSLINEGDFFTMDNYKKIKKYFVKEIYYTLDNSFSSFDLKIVEEIFDKYYYEYKLAGGAVGFTIFFTIFNVIFTNIIALLLALALDTKIRSKNFLRSLFFVPNVLSLVVVGFIWSFLFKVIAKVPLFNIGWLGDPNIAPISVIIVQVWQNCGYVMLIYLAGLQSIPSDILEVSELDGATGLNKLLKIIIPLLLPSLTISLFLTITNSLRCFDIIWVLTGGGPGYATTPIVIDIYNNAFSQNRFGYGTAKAILLCFIIIAITITQLSIMKKKEVEY